MISEKNERAPGGSGAAMASAGRSHVDAARRSPNRSTPLLDAWQNRAQCAGWNSAVVTTSVRSSMRGGLRSTSVYGGAAGASRCQRLTRRSSADRNVSPSEQRDSELTW